MSKVKSKSKYIDVSEGKKCIYSGKRLKPFPYDDIILNPFDVFEAEPGLEVVERFALALHKNLKKVTLPDSVKIIEPLAFMSTGIIEATIPSKVTKIPMFAYYYCHDLENVIFNDQLTVIDYRAFYDCYSFSGNNGELVLPDSVCKIEKEAFLGTAISSIEVSEDCYISDEKRDKSGKGTGIVEYELRDENNKKTGEIQTIYIKRRKKENIGDIGSSKSSLSNETYQKVKK